MKNTPAMLLAAALASCAALQAARPAAGFVEISAEQARREIGALSQQDTSAAMWIWADKYVYQPGEQLTLRWTVRPNSDLYPYTIVAYRINNQTGARSYLPGGGAAAVDIFGQTVEQGFRISRLPEANRAVLVGAGGSVASSPVTVPNELGMHTLVVELRDYTGTRPVKTAYFKIGVVDGFDTLSGAIESNRTLVNTRAYRLSGVVPVRNNAVLTIQPGTFILGQPGSQPPSVLLVTRNGRLNAVGTRSRPIVMTSNSTFGQRRRGDWGGLILLGRAPANTPAERTFIEGLDQSEDSRYGGDDPNWSCGTMRYLRVEYAGVTLSANNETNGITWGGCGAGTVAEYLQAHYGNDDAFEWFGGSVDGKYLVATYAEDDNFDFQLGWTGRLQYGLVLQNPTDRGNRGIEGDNSEFNNLATPFSNPQLYNLTIVGSGQPASSEAGSPGVLLRRGARGSFNNMLVTNFAGRGFDLNDAPTRDQATANQLITNGVLLWNNGLTTQQPNTVPGQVTDASAPFAAGTSGQLRQFVAADPLLRRPLEFSDPDFRPQVGSPVFRANWVVPPDDGFFDQSARFIGAFGEIDWTEEWTNFLTEQDIAP